MDARTLHEMKMTAYHRAVLRRMCSNPDLKRRVVQHLEDLMHRQPDMAPVWEAWCALLDRPEAEAVADLQADSVEGKRLRMVSPVTAVLYPAERAMVWRCVGWLIFLHHYLAAAADLGLDLEEQAAILGLDGAEIGTWSHAPPERMAEERLHGLRQVITVRHILTILKPVLSERRQWLETVNPDWEASPLALLCRGEGAVVCDHLARQVGPRLRAADLPRC